MPVPEQPPGVEIEEVGGHIIAGVPTAICAFVGSCAQGPAEDPVRVTSYAEFESTFGGLSADSGLGYAVQDFFANGGGSAIILRLVAKDGVLTETDYVGAGFEDADKGIYALAKVDLFTLLCLPPPVPDGDLPQTVWKAALAYCARRRAFLIVDAPGGATPSTVTAWPAEHGLTGGAARNGAVYFPRIRRLDPLRNGAAGDFAACGAVAGVMARTDADRGVWTAPANAGLAGVSGLTVVLTDGQNGTLNASGINCLRTFPGRGPVVWGARTLAGTDALHDEFKYVSVRRLALYIEESVYRGTQWAVFEPNGEPLWTQLGRSVGAFMQNLFQQGAIQGQTAKDAYFVRCDRTTMTQDDIDQGLVTVMVGFAPVKPAEFVIIRIQLSAAAPTG
ncbi:phage tail sheath family protein [Mycolicibacterium septicum DSM 44393]|uniref:Phage tail sheath family protein n=1 Tax=Mycolicibacterium septicum DSM 44393 TaxID=1341646 RepID=A0A7X6MMG9_9MYCO|nr:phage tail sheath subtilisin-like domain-containing protein [Mycolicibacterium septicum]NKZ10879.1 phage tail sheath family protein [Mycolicibacterium septicum DSM 44393]